MNKISFYCIISLVLSLSSQGLVKAHNSVVVIPLGVDSAPIRNVTVVAKSGGDFTSLEDAVDSLITNDSSNPSLIYIAPGEYIISRKIIVQPNTIIRGSGIEATKLVSRIRTAEPMFEMHGGTLSDLSISMVVQPSFLSSVAIMSESNTTGKLRDLDINILSTVASISPIGISFTFSNASIENSSVVVSGTNSQGIFAQFTGFNFKGLLVNAATPLVCIGEGGGGVIENSTLLVAGIDGSAIRNLCQTTAPFESAITVKSSTLTSRGAQFVTNFATALQPSPIYISQSSLVGDGSITGDQVFCTSSDNGQGAELNNDCSE